MNLVEPNTMTYTELNVLIEEHNNIVKAPDFKTKRNDLDRDYPEVLRAYEIKRIIYNEIHITDDSKTGLLPIMVEYKPLQEKEKPNLSTQITNSQTSMEAKEVLQQCIIEGTVIKLPNIQLDRNKYLEVKNSLELIGGKWKGGEVFGFVFPSDPTELLDQIANGEKRNLKKEFQFFATPDDLADQLVEYAELKDGDRILEPSAGNGAIVKAINRATGGEDVYCYELMPTNQTVLKKISTVVFLGDDFLSPNGTGHLQFDKIIANPPFSKNQDIDHVYEMYSRLKSGGRLVSITSKHWQMSSNSKETHFKKWLNGLGAKVHDIESGSFKESGTSIAAALIIIDK